MNKTMDFQQVSDALSMAACEKDAAEVHGLLCGLLCCNQKIHYDAWEHEIFTAPPNTSTQSALNQLYHQTCEEFSQDYPINLLLPKDEAELDARTEALANWCSGFVLGMTVGGITNLNEYSEEVAEFSNDLIEISRISSYDLENSDEEDASFIEIVEYVRTGVLLIKEEVNQEPKPPTIH